MVCEHELSMDDHACILTTLFHDYDIKHTCSVADLGFVEGGFVQFLRTNRARNSRNHAHVWLKPRPFSIVSEQLPALPVQSMDFERIFC